MSHTNSYPNLFSSVADLTAGIVPPGDCGLAPSPLLPVESDLQGWNSDHHIFDDLVRDVQPKNVIEVGSWKGASALHLAKATESLGSDIYCVDTWLGGFDHAISKLPQDDRKLDQFGSPRLYEQFLRNFLGTEYAKRIYPIRNSSANGARILRHHGVSADLIYIDGSHEYEDVYADLLAYVPLLTEEGVMFGDDFRSAGVFAAVIRFAHEHNCRLQEIDHNFWILK